MTDEQTSELLGHLQDIAEQLERIADRLATVRTLSKGTDILLNVADILHEMAEDANERAK